MLHVPFKNAMARVPYVHRMTKLFMAFALVASLSCKAEDGSAFDRAAEAASLSKMKEAAKLYAEAAGTEADPVRRAKAELKAANLEWRLFHQYDSARARLK